MNDIIDFCELQITEWTAFLAEISRCGSGTDLDKLLTKFPDVQMLLDYYGLHEEGQFHSEEDEEDGEEEEGDEDEEEDTGEDGEDGEDDDGEKTDDEVINHMWQTHMAKFGLTMGLIPDIMHVFFTKIIPFESVIQGKISKSLLSECLDNLALIEPDTALKIERDEDYYPYTPAWVASCLSALDRRVEEAKRRCDALQPRIVSPIGKACLMMMYICFDQKQQCAIIESMRKCQCSHDEILWLDNFVDCCRLCMWLSDGCLDQAVASAAYLQDLLKRRDIFLILP